MVIGTESGVRRNIFNIGEITVTVCRLNSYEGMKSRTEVEDCPLVGAGKF